MLKSTRWSGERRALHSHDAVVIAIASAARGPKSAAPASAPTALTEIEPSSQLERERLPDADERDHGDEAEDVRARAEERPERRRPRRRRR